MTVAGQGLAPTRADVAAVAQQASVPVKVMREIIGAVEDAVGDWPVHARRYQASRSSIRMVQERRDAVRVAFNSTDDSPPVARRGVRRPLGRAS